MKNRTVSTMAEFDGIGSSAQGRDSLARDIGSVVYAIQCPDGAIKIGFTSDLASRMRAYGKGYAPLGFMPGTKRQESLIHLTLRAHRVRGHEYYNHDPAVLAVVNNMRAHLGKRPLKSVPRAA